MSINAEWVRDEIQALQADNAALRKRLGEAGSSNSWKLSRNAWKREAEFLEAENERLRELLREWVIGWGGFNSADLKPGGLVIRTRAALKGEKYE